MASSSQQASVAIISKCISPHPSAGPLSPELQAAINAMHIAVMMPHPDQPSSLTPTIDDSNKEQHHNNY